MIKENGKLEFLNTTAFLYINNSMDLLNNRDLINESISDERINAIIFVFRNEDNSFNLNQQQIFELYNWLQSMPILSIAVMDNECYGDVLLLSMVCHIRLGGRDLSIQFSNKDSDIVFNFEEQCQLLMGKETDRIYTSLLDTTINSKKALSERLINQIIDMSNLEKEVQKFVNRIFGDKTDFQIRAIIKCFNNYKRYGINSDRSLLLEEEINQFCNLAVKRNQYEN